MWKIKAKRWRDSFRYLQLLDRHAWQLEGRKAAIHHSFLLFSFLFKLSHQHGSRLLEQLGLWSKGIKQAETLFPARLPGRLCTFKRRRRVAANFRFLCGDETETAFSNWMSCNQIKYSSLTKCSWQIFAGVANHFDSPVFIHVVIKEGQKGFHISLSTSISLNSGIKFSVQTWILTPQTCWQFTEPLKQKASFHSVIAFQWYLVIDRQPKWLSAANVFDLFTQSIILSCPRGLLGIHSIHCPGTRRSCLLLWGAYNVAIFDRIASTCCRVPAAVVALIRAEKAKYWRGFGSQWRNNTRAEGMGSIIINKWLVTMRLTTVLSF